MTSSPTLIVETGAEDVAVGERIQRTLDSGANETIVFGRFESTLTWYHQKIERTLMTAQQI